MPLTPQQIDYIKELDSKGRQICSGQAFLASILCTRQNLFSDSFGVKPPAAVCGLIWL